MQIAANIYTKDEYNKAAEGIVKVLAAPAVTSTKGLQFLLKNPVNHTTEIYNHTILLTTSVCDSD